MTPEEHSAILEVRERLIRIEERQQGILSMLKVNLQKSDALEVRVNSLEALKHRAVGVFAVLVMAFTMAWEIVKNYFGRNN